MNLRAFLHGRFAAAFGTAGAGAEPMIGAATRPEFGDYQANGAMAAAKQARTQPRMLASAVVEALGDVDFARSVTVEGPGFINITLSPAFVGEQLRQVEIDRTERPDTIVVDYSSPNLAKEMHVGHLRTTIGDSMVRVLEALGHRVIRQNHVGDWGTQFGMLVAHLEDVREDAPELRDLEVFYAAARERFDSDPAFAERARHTVVALQGGDERVRGYWQRFVDISLSHCRSVYDTLGITLGDKDLDAESRYNDDLPNVIADLESAGLLTVDDGAKCVFLDELETPLIVQKRDGGYLYATTDLAAVRYRSDHYRADRILYFVDTRQTLHFRQLFAVARKAGFAHESCALEHHPFGAIMGPDNRPFKTRSGDVVKLADLLDEAVRRARSLVIEKNPELDEEEADRIARVVGIGAVKYADVSKHRASDYVFDWDAMLNFDGNTAPYLQYAYARIQSLFRRGDVDPSALTEAPAISNETERRLGVALLRFQETLELVAAEALPHYLSGYLYSLAGDFMKFYETCPVLDAPGALRDHRLKLCALTGETLQRGLGLLGIETVDRM